MEPFFELVELDALPICIFANRYTRAGIIGIPLAIAVFCYVLITGAPVNPALHNALVALTVLVFLLAVCALAVTDFGLRTHRAWIEAMGASIAPKAGSLYYSERIGWKLAGKL